MLAVGGGLVVAFRLPLAHGRARPKTGIRAQQRLHPHQTSHGTVTLIMPQVEMGQGIYTSVAMILAEELDAAFRPSDAGKPRSAQDDKLYGNPTFGIQVTGNSNSVRSFWLPLRKAAAGARAILIQAAALQWKVEAAGIRTEKGEAIHEASGRRLRLCGGMIDRAQAALTPPHDPRRSRTSKISS